MTARTGRRVPPTRGPADGTAGPAGAALTWPEARRAAHAAGRRPQPVERTLAGALGHHLAVPLDALTDLPAFDTSAMDGWAVHGPGPWRLAGELLAGCSARTPLAPGRAVRHRHRRAGPARHDRRTAQRTRPTRSGRVRRRDREDAVLRVRAPHPAPAPGQDIRPRGQECRAGERLLAAGSVLSAAVLGLAAAAGYDTLSVLPRPRTEVLVLGDELLREGLPHDGRVRDALGPMLPPWLRELGADVPGEPRWIGDDVRALREAVAASTADLLVTTGGTAAGPVDHVHPVLVELGADLRVDGVAVRPGHPMLLAVLPDGRPWVGLPGNPLAAASGVLTLVVPLLRALAGRPGLGSPCTARLAEPVGGHPEDTRLVPVAFRGPGDVTPLRHHGPAMLRGFAEADGMAVVPPGGAAAGAEVEVLPAPGRSH